MQHLVSVSHTVRACRSQNFVDIGTLRPFGLEWGVANP